MAKYLDSTGVKHYTEKIKDGTIVAGKAKEIVEGGKVPASTIDGIISLDHIPQGAKERVVVVANQAARYALTTDNVQLGDTVKENDTGLMYVVVDESNLGNASGYLEYLSGQTKEQLGYNADNVNVGMGEYRYADYEQISVDVTDGFGNDNKDTVFLHAADSDYAGLMTAADKMKLDKITLNSSGAISSDVEWGSVVNKPSVTLPSGSLDLGADLLSIGQSNIIPIYKDVATFFAGGLNVGVISNVNAGTVNRSLLIRGSHEEITLSGAANQTRDYVIQVNYSSIIVYTSSNSGSTWTSEEMYTNDSALTTSEIDTAIAAAN